ncbi:hypothetical protein BDZ89DRAFT_1141846 [Hymenopellis radicata]|nr:hypothetical protein BDZ89DRAFT_1141846 [Hymenopellis radicata]
MTPEPVKVSQNPALYECPYTSVGCKFTPTTYRWTRDHINDHTGEKPYGCEHCNWAGSSAIQYRKHANDRHGYYPSEIPDVYGPDRRQCASSSRQPERRAADKDESCGQTSPKAHRHAPPSRNSKTAHSATILPPSARNSYQAECPWPSNATTCTSYDVAPSSQWQCSNASPKEPDYLSAMLATDPESFFASQPLAENFWGL